MGCRTISLVLFELALTRTNIRFALFSYVVAALSVQQAVSLPFAASISASGMYNIIYILKNVRSEEHTSELQSRP